MHHGCVISPGGMCAACPLFSFSFMSLRELWVKAAGERLGVCMCAGVGDLGWRWKWKKKRAGGGVGGNV